VHTPYINREVNFLDIRRKTISLQIFQKMKWIVLAAIFASTQAIELTPETWDDSTAGKAVFVKFFAPWCGHCKRMKPAWDSLMKSFETSDSVLVADVDCIGDGKPLCDKVGVKGFPTIKYGDPNNLQDYKGGRDEEELDKFAKTLKPACVVSTLENCSDEDKKVIEELQSKPIEHLKDMVLAEAKEREQANTEFKEEVEKLQGLFQELSKTKESTLEDIKERYNIGFVKQVIKNVGEKSKPEL
jgi:protein disulfide-isomerase-like protein